MTRALLLATVAAAAAVGAAARPAPSAHTPAEAGPAAPSPSPADDPFPIRRIRATEADLADVRKQLDPGPLVRLPLAEFEDRVRAAARAAEARPTPRLAEARYRAALDGADLVGTAEWELVSHGPGPLVFPLDPLRLALGPATWGDGREAVVGAAAGEPAGVWVDRPGRQTLKFRWSAAGAAEPGELRFELRAPPAPAAVLDLDLPAGRVPAVPAADGLLTGPTPRPGGRAGWQVRFGGRSRLGLSVRPAGDPGGPAAAGLVARYDLAPGQLACAFEYELRPAKGAVGEWAFTVDPGLRVTDVVVNNRAGWAVDPGPADKPRRLRVTLRQPGAGGKVLVTAVAPFPDPARPPGDPLPAVRPATAVLDDETVSVRLAPGLRVENWNPGDYRLTDAQTEPGGTRVLSLTGTLLPPGADRPHRRLPSVAATAPEHDFTAATQVAWRLDPDRSAATVRVRVRVRRGPLFQLALTVPPGYALVRAGPDDLVAHAARVSGGVVAEFAKPLTAGQSADVTFEFRGPRLAPGRGPFPRFSPTGAAEQTGVIGVLPDPAWDVAARPGAGTTRAGWLDLSDPPAPAGAAAAFRYRAGDPDGGVELTPARAAFTADGLTVRVRAGALPLVLLSDAAPAAGRAWRVAGSGNAVTDAVPVPLAGLLSPFTPAARVLPARVWVVRFARPVTGKVTLETAGGPGVAVLGATATPPAATGPPAPPPAPRGWAFADLYLVTTVRTPAEVVAVFGGTVASAEGPVLPVRLPDGAVVRAASVGGAWAGPGALTLSDGVLNLPLPAGGPVRFEVRYRVPADTGRAVTRVRSPEPQLPGDAAPVGRWWAFAPDVLAGWPVRAWDAGAELPATLGGPPLPGAVAFRSEVDEVRVAPAGWADAAGVGLAAVLLGLAWAGGRRRHPFCAVVVAAGVFAAAAATLLGPPWWQRAAAAPLVAGIVGAAGAVVARGHRPRAAAAAALALGLTVTLSESVAQPPAPATVVILPKDAGGVETVVAPKAVLDRLAAIRPPAPGVVLTAAEYALTADDGTARVVGRFVAHALGDADPVLVLPLADARLEKVTVNGAAAFPAAPKAGVYAVPLPGKGRHEVEVRFAVPVAGAGPEREVRFGVPEVPETKVVADLPGGARLPQVVGRVGRRDEAAAGGRVRLAVDAGAAKAVQVRWRDGAGGAAVRVKEGCVWDVSPAGAELTAAYLVTVGPGTVSGLRFDVPAELDPLGVTVRPLDPGGSAALRDWTVDPEAGGFRPLRLDFQGPTGGRLAVVLSLAPRKAVTRQPVLRFPKVVAPGLPAEPDAAYWLRAKKEEVVVEAAEWSGAVALPADAPTRDLADVKELRLDPAAAPRLYRPTAAGSAELRPRLGTAAELPAVTTDTAWHLGPGQAEATGTVRWVGKDARALVEFAAPGVKVTEVRGAEVAGWAQPAGRVQVWLRRPVKEGEVSWSGTAAAPAVFEAVSPRVVDGRLVSDAVTVRPVEGYAVTVDRDRGWVAGGGTFRTTNPMAPPVRVVLRPVRPALRPDELGWLRPAPKPVAGPAVPDRPPAARPDPVAAPAETPAEAPGWVWPASAVAGWAAAAAGLVVLAVRLPRATWPEQFGLVGGMFGAAAVGGWWVGPAAWAAARAVWVAEVAWRRGQAT
ncbi:MAG: hypothetical protein C0501_29040 [Isosphaera sp.]|nr:hypothetical protein [Isosphaera sp.]